MPPVGFKPTISTGERPQTHDLDRATATEIGSLPVRFTFIPVRNLIFNYIEGPSSTSHVYYTRMPSPIYQYAINLVMSLPIRRSTGALMNVSVREHRALNN